MHVAPLAHDSEHEPVQRTVHVDPSPHDTLLLEPTVTSQSDSPLQSMLHESPHEPVHVLLIVQASVQLSPLQPESPMSHDELAGHAHDDPVHSGGGVSEPHAVNVKAKTTRRRLIITHVTRATTRRLCTILARESCATACRRRP